MHILQRDVLFCGLVGVVRGARLGLYEIFGGDEFLVFLNCRAGGVFGCELELGLDAHGYRLHRIQSMIHCTRRIQFPVISEISTKKRSNMIITVLEVRGTEELREGLGDVANVVHVSCSSNKTQDLWVSPMQSEGYKCVSASR